MWDQGWGLAEPPNPDIAASSSEAAYFPLRWELRPRGLNSHGGLAQPLSLLLRAWSFIFIIYRITHKYLLSSFGAPGTVLSSGVILPSVEHTFQ